ncbi:MAG: hypothetical protein GQ565_09775 [Candidatus Aegiribacteria sp.]|nr:hypothetical protein [Candidatus Aegiribacteria sp.]
METTKKHTMSGCCGMSCSLCPRFHTDGKSKCLGCGPDPHCVYCSTYKCCSVKKAYETCAECIDSPCARISNLADWKRFSTGKRWLLHIEEIKKNGLEKWERIQEQKAVLLKQALEQYNSGRSKGIICLSFLLFDIPTIQKLLEKANAIISDIELKDRAKKFKVLIKEFAKKKEIKLK